LHPRSSGQRQWSDLLLRDHPQRGEPFRGAFRDGLKESGYIDGRNVSIEVRLADGHYERMPSLVNELLERKVNVLACGSGAGVIAKGATTTIPIVALSAGDPVRSGLVASLNRPGGNITAVALYAFSLGPKRLQLLREVVPDAKTIAILINPTQPDPESKNDREEVEAAARATGIHIETITCSSEHDFLPAFADMQQRGSQALLVMADPLFSNWREQLVALAARFALPAIYAADGSAKAGGLMSYGSSISDGFRQMGIYAGKILDGASPGDLPVMQAVKVELVLNLKTAKSLGISFPISLLGRADEVIE
jgi:putative ABC transport system substrate-binding protein